MKKAIAMKCTQEDWDSIKRCFTENQINSVTSFETYNYLINFDDKKTITNIDKKSCWNNFWNQEPEIHETFNAKIFLEACGIDTKPTLEELKEYFKDVETAQESCYGKIQFKVNLDDIYLSEFGNYLQSCKHYYLWSEAGYAKILTYKQQKFEITKEQILKLHNNEGSRYVQEWFPDAFEPELEVGKWYKSEKQPKNIIFIESINGNDFKCYGFDRDGYWMSPKIRVKFANYIESTPQEVKSALKNEAKKRYKKGDCINGLYMNKISFLSFESTGKAQSFIYVDAYNSVWMNVGNGRNEKVFDNGKWATIIETITIQEAEQILRSQGIKSKIVG